MATMFDDARLLDQWCYDMLLGDWPRALNRAVINAAANGDPPQTKEEQEETKSAVNVSDLRLTRVLHEARQQFMNALESTGQYFSATTDWGPGFKREGYAAAVTLAGNRPLKRSVEYYERTRSKVALLVLHGISPGVWETRQVVIPREVGVEDILMPAGTLLGFRNLPFFAVRRSFTGYELQNLTIRSRRDPGWNMGLVKKILKWLDSEMTQLMGNNFPEIWSPEKWEERSKEQAGFYAADQVPTVETFDIYGWAEADKNQPAGWVRRIIIDSWSNPGAPGGAKSVARNDKYRQLQPSQKDDFLFSSGESRVAESWRQIASFQFADLSAVAPFRYHSVRSLGWMLYAICHLNNRLFCGFSQAVFESLLQYFKVKSMSDVQRALKVELANMGIFDETLAPLPPGERWQPNAQLVELGLATNQQIIEQHSRSYTQGIDNSPRRGEKTKFQVMAEVQAATALVQSAFGQMYQYEEYECREIFRRLLIPDSRDPDARNFRAYCLGHGVPEKLLVPEAWDIQRQRIIGAGNQTIEMLIAQELLQIRPALDPEPQRIVLRKAVQAWTKDPALALELVPETPARATPSTHDAELTFAAIMSGVPVEPQTGINHIEHIGTMLKVMQFKLMVVLKKGGGLADPQTLDGFKMALVYIKSEIAMLAGDKEEKAVVKAFVDALAKLENEVRALEQRLQERMRKAAQAQQQAGNGGIDLKTAAAVKGKMLLDQVKAQNMAKSHAQRMQQRDQQFKAELQHELMQHQAEIAKTDMTGEAEIQRNRLSSLNEE